MTDIYYTEKSESDAMTTYPLARIVVETRTTAGVDVVVGESRTYGTMLFLDGELQSASADEHIYHESLVHPAMAGAHATLGRPVRSVLVVGGGEGATVREVLRWNPEHVDWVDYDRDLVDLCRIHLRWAPSVMADARVCFRAADIRDTLPELGNYDVILLDLPDPDGDTGYLYSAPFWRDMRAHLVPGGYMVTHCGPVRPFGSIGEGFQRVWQTTGEADMRFDPAGFYPVSIPSFQGTWGFWMWANTTAAAQITPFAYVQLPADLRVVDTEQLRVWGRGARVWSEAIANSWPRS